MTNERRSDTSIKQKPEINLIGNEITPKDSLLDKKDIRRIKRYCVFPKLAMVSLIMVFVLSLLLLIGEMIHDLIFCNEGSFGPAGGIILFAIFVFINCAIFAYCAIATKIGMNGKHYKAIVERLRVQQTTKNRSAEFAGAIGLSAAGHMISRSDNEIAQGVGSAATIAGDIATAAVAIEELAEIDSNADAIAKAYGVKVPNVGRVLVAIIAVPLIIMIVFYITQYVTATQTMDKNQAIAVTQTSRICDALEAAGASVETIPDPSDSYCDNGYSVYGYLSGDMWSADRRYVKVDFDKNGVITDIWYEECIDTDKSMSENLTQCQKDFDKLGNALSTVNAKTKASALLTKHTFSDEFRQQFLATDIYTEIWLSERTDDFYIYFFFNTEQQSDYNEDTHPAVELNIKAR